MLDSRAHDVVEQTAPDGNSASEASWDAHDQEESQPAEPEPPGDQTADGQETGTQEPQPEVEDLQEVVDHEQESASEEDVVTETVENIGARTREAPIPLPRQSRRARDTPQWMKSGDYVMLQQTSQPP